MKSFRGTNTPPAGPVRAAAGARAETWYALVLTPGFEAAYSSSRIAIRPYPNWLRSTHHVTAIEIAAAADIREKKKRPRLSIPKIGRNRPLPPPKTGWPP